MMTRVSLRLGYRKGEVGISMHSLCLNDFHVISDEEDEFFGGVCFHVDYGGKESVVKLKADSKGLYIATDNKEFADIPEKLQLSILSDLVRIIEQARARGELQKAKEDINRGGTYGCN